jgi:hypothetical protein
MSTVAASGVGRRVAPWGIALAIGLNLPSVVRWWHPLCAMPGEGPGYFAWGFPFPWAEPTGVSSLEFGFMPIALALNLMVTAALAAWIFARILRPVAGWRPGARRVVVVAGLCVGLAALGMLGATLGFSGIPSGGLSDDLRVYRPWVLAKWDGRRGCYL